MQPCSVVFEGCHLPPQKGLHFRDEWSGQGNTNRVSRLGCGSLSMEVAHCHWLLLLVLVFLLDWDSLLTEYVHITISTNLQFYCWFQQRGQVLNGTLVTEFSLLYVVPPSQAWDTVPCQGLNCPFSVDKHKKKYCTVIRTMNKAQFLPNEYSKEAGIYWWDKQSQTGILNIDWGCQGNRFHRNKNMEGFRAPSSAWKTRMIILMVNIMDWKDAGD